MDRRSLAISSSQFPARCIKSVPEPVSDKSIFDISGIDLRYRSDCIFLIAKCLVNVLKGELRRAGFAF